MWSAAPSRCPAVNLELDGNSAEGVLTFAADGRQTLQGTLAADEINLTPYLSPSASSPRPTANGAAPRSTSTV